MRTTTKRVVDRIRNYIATHVIENDDDFAESDYPVWKQLEDQVSCLRTQRMEGEWQLARQLVENGEFAVYVDDARALIKEWLEETDAEANCYSEDKVWKLYVNLMAREIVAMIRQGRSKYAKTICKND